RVLRARPAQHEGEHERGQDDRGAQQNQPEFHGLPVKLDRAGPLTYLRLMATRPILTAPDPRLKAVSTDVAAVDDEIRRLIDDMADSMYAADGIGLAAVQ